MAIRPKRRRNRYRTGARHNQYEQFMRSSQWTRFSRQMRDMFPLCQDCEMAGSTQVHHLFDPVRFPSRALSPEHVLCLCEACHKKRHT